MKIRVHVQNDFCIACDKVFVDIELNAVPRVGEILNLLPNHVEILESKAKASIDIAENYYEYLGIEEDVTSQNMHKISFCRLLTVCQVVFNADSDIISIELEV